MSVIDQISEMAFPFADRVLHLGHEVVALVDADDPGERAGDVVEQLFNDVDGHALPR